MTYLHKSQGIKYSETLYSSFIRRIHNRMLNTHYSQNKAPLVFAAIVLQEVTNLDGFAVIYSIKKNSLTRTLGIPTRSHAKVVALLLLVAAKPDHA